MPSLIRTSHHSIKFLTESKTNEYHRFIDSYQKAVTEIIDKVWNAPYHWKSNGTDQVFDVSKDLLDIPKFGITADLRPSDSPLSARAYKAAIKQAFGIIKSQVSVRHNLLYTRKKILEKGESTKQIDLLLLSKSKQITKPVINQINPELCSDNCEFLDCKELKTLAARRNRNPQSYFDGFLELNCLGEFGDDNKKLKSYNKNKIRIPIQYHRASNQLRKRGYQMKNAFSLKRDGVSIRWEMPEPNKKSSGTVIGMDTGRHHVISCSNGIQITQGKHGWTLNKIVELMQNLEKKNSRKFKRLKAHQINFIGWAVNQLSLNEVLEIRLEDVRNMGNISKYWYYPLIRQRISMRAEEEMVFLKLQSSSYRSQRCNQCGYVHRFNRKEEEFNCRACGHHSQADLNAAKNHVGFLPKCNSKLIDKRKISKKEGFYWLSNGIFTLSERQEQLAFLKKNSNITVPTNKKKNSKYIFTFE